MTKSRADDTFPFDLARFNKACKSKGTTSAAVAAELGQTAGFWGYRGKIGTLPRVHAYWLEEAKGIRPEDYAPLEVAAQGKTDMLAMRQMIKSVVTEVINERFSNPDFISALKDIIRPAVTASLVMNNDTLYDAIERTINKQIDEALG